MQTLGSFALVGIGGLLGSVVRFSFGLAFRGLSQTWPAGTLLSNVLACLVIGFIAETGLRTGLIKPEMRLLLMTGLCGGLSTMSSFIYETVRFLQDSEILNATVYFLGTLLLCGFVFILGIWVSRLIFK
jgi:fluoride exporter